MTLSPQQHGLLYWYTSSVILGLCTLYNILHKLVALYKRKTYVAAHPAQPPRIVPAALAPSSPLSVETTDSSFDEKGEAASASSKRLSLLPAAIGIAIRNTLLLTSIPIRVPVIFKLGPEDGKARKKYSWQYDIPVYEAMWTFVYFLAVFVISFYGTAWDVAKYTKTTAYISAAQMPMIIALAGKNNLISFATGLTYEKLNFLHRAAGRCCFLTLWIHSFGRIAMVDGLSRTLWQQAYIYWGMIGLLAFTLLMVFSLRNLRQRFYEFFLLTHIALGALTIAGFWLHWPTISIWLYPGIALWAFDRLLRILRIVFLNRVWITKAQAPAAQSTESSYQVESPTPPPTQAHIHLLTPSTLLITLPATRLHWAAGQHLYVVMPSISRFPWEAHPFSAATAVQQKGPNELVFVVRVRDGFTKTMRNAVVQHQKTTAEDTLIVPAAVEGPYGVGRELESYDTVLLIAGGSGISFALAHLLQIVRDAKLGKGRVRDVRIIWMCKSRLHLNWISNILHQQLHSLPTNLTISLHIHVTKHYIPRAQSLPCAAVPAHSTPRWQSVLKDRASVSRRRMSRIMSTMSWASWGSARNMDARRGSAVSNKAGEKLTPAKKLPRSPRGPDSAAGDASDDEKSDRSSIDAPPMSNFVWSEGYQGRDLPTRPEAVESSRGGRRRASEAPSMGMLSEEEDEGPTSLVRERQPSVAMRSDASSASSRRGSELLSPQPVRGVLSSSSMRESHALQSLDVSLVVEEDAGPTSPRTPRSARRSMVDRVRDVSPTRRISFVDVSYESSRRGSEMPLSKKLSFSTPLFTQPFLKVDVQPSSHSTFLGAIETPSRETTPMKDAVGASFEQEEPLRRRASIGLDSFVSWHEGRADLVSILTELQKVAHGSISVNVCGPRSLLNSSRDAVRLVSGPKEALAGENRIDYYAETFGW